MFKPQISIIVLTYNQQDFIAQTLDSLLSQKCSVPYEILVGDDCSTDNTRIIVNEYITRFPQIIVPLYQDSNIGAARNLVFVAQKARGEIISVCDGDDYWYSDDVLQMQWDIFNENPEVGLICAKALCFNQSNQKYTGVLGSSVAESLYDMCFYNQDIAAPTNARRRDLFLQCIEDSQWYIDNNKFYDTVIAYWFAHNSKIRFIDKVTAVYRVRSESACHSNDYNIKLKYQKRYYEVKWRFLLNHQIEEEKMYNLLIKDYDETIKIIEWLAKLQVYNSMSYKVGSVILWPLKKILKLIRK